MDRFLVGFVAVAMLLLLFPLSHAAWSYLPYYHSAYNITVVNWSYSQTGLPGFHPRAGFALVQLSNVVNPSTIATRGYTASLQPIGYVPFWLVAQQGNTVVLLLSNQTNESIYWNQSTVFYNSSLGLVGAVCLPSYYTSTSTSTPASTAFVSGFQFGRQCTGAIPTYPAGGASNQVQQFNIFGPLTLGTFNFTPFFVSSNTVNLQFKLNVCGTGLINSQCNPLGTARNNSSVIGFQNFFGYTNSFLLFSNRSMVGRPFNATWWPNTGSRFVVKSNSTHYDLAAPGCAFVSVLFCNAPYVTNSPTFVASQNANTVFLGQTDGIGFEAWFSSITNATASQGMSVLRGGVLIANSVKTKPTGSVLFGPSLTFNITVTVNTPTTYDLMPAFTTNYIATQILNNTNQSATVTCPNPNANNYFCFSNRLEIDNIRWIYNYSTLATGNSLNTTPGWFNFSTGHVPYAYLNISQPSYNNAWGLGCDNIYITAFSGTVNLGAVPYTVLNCSGSSSVNPSARIILQNTTSINNAFNNIYIYYGARTGQGQTSNVLKNWNFINSNSATIQDSGNVPYVITLDNPLNLRSYVVKTGSTGDVAYFGYNGLANPPALGTVLSAFSHLGFNHAVFDTHTPITFLVNNNGIATTYETIGSPFLANSIRNTTTLGVEFAFQTGTAQFLVSNSNGLGHAYSLNAIVSCGLIKVVCITTQSANALIQCQLTNTCPFTGPPTTIPQTSNGLNYTATTTMNFNGIGSNTIQIGDTGLFIPIVALEALEILLMLIAMAAISEEHNMAAIAVIVVQWIIGTFRFQLLGIAIMATLLVIVEHLILESRRAKSRGGERHAR